MINWKVEYIYCDANFLAQASELINKVKALNIQNRVEPTADEMQYFQTMIDNSKEDLAILDEASRSFFL